MTAGHPNLFGVAGSSYSLAITHATSTKAGLSPTHTGSCSNTAAARAGHRGRPPTPLNVQFNPGRRTTRDREHVDVSHDNRTVRIYGHYPAIAGKDDLMANFAIADLGSGAKAGATAGAKEARTTRSTARKNANSGEDHPSDQNTKETHHRAPPAWEGDEGIMPKTPIWPDRIKTRADEAVQLERPKRTQKIVVAASDLSRSTP
ncbi:hypothetical protein QBC37DRAFT_374788 [Rhypophila decipiens]|uniref:Uncharacterized protein n=1 Tax=Rhypophila decipiens TaxID=261697 RepID=A0AAN6YB01_9PEZI|nr:hypothetical protein QBC37DRAFT_374788 [Rhypophila decipiens]